MADDKTRKQVEEAVKQGYLMKLDGGDIDPMMDAFSEDAVLVFTGDRFPGKEPIKDFFTEFCKRLDNRNHAVNKMAIEVSGEKATASCDMTFTTKVVKTGYTFKICSHCFTCRMF